MQHPRDPRDTDAVTDTVTGAVPDVVDDPPPYDEDGTVGYRGVTACHAVGISYRQLDYWARTALVVPSIRDASGSGTQRLYSFRDLVVLKVVKRLLDAGVSLQNIRRAIDTLRSRGVDDLAGITLISDGTTVYECRSPEEVVDLLQGGQGVFGIAIGGAFKEIQGSLSHLPAEPAAGPGPADEPETTATEEGVSDELAARRARRRAG
jgi:DNA-binding transcriptional MerR regulator